MPELILKDGKHFWAFPELPFDTGEQTRRLLNFYLRTNPATNEIDLTQWATYPNNATPKLLKPLLDFLARLTDLNTATLEAEPALANWDQMVIENDRWRQRLEFYQATVDGLVADFPDVSAGGSSPASNELAVNVVNPLFLGWYPNEQEPFSEMPEPYSHQHGQVVMDLYYPYSLANQLTISTASITESWDLYVEDMAARSIWVLTHVLPIIPTLKIIPLAIFLGLVIGIASRVKK